MVCTALASTSSPVAAARKGMAGLPVVQPPRAMGARVGRVICASQRKEAVPIVPVVAATVAVAALATPELAQAATMNPSVSNLLNSVLAGGVVGGLLIGAVSLVAQFDPVNRR